MSMINPADYEQMMKLGNQNRGLQQQMQMVKALRAPDVQAQGYSKKGAALTGISQILSALMQAKMGGQMTDNTGLQQQMMMRALMARMGQQQNPAQQGGYGLMPPQMKPPGQLGYDPNMLSGE
jgi:hypothetical protein